MIDKLKGSTSSSVCAGISGVMNALAVQSLSRNVWLESNSPKPAHILSLASYSTVRRVVDRVEARVEKRSPGITIHDGSLRHLRGWRAAIRPLLVSPSCPACRLPKTGVEQTTSSMSCLASLMPCSRRIFRLSGRSSFHIPA